MKYLKLFEGFDFDDDGEDEEDVINVETPVYTVYTFSRNGNQRRLGQPTTEWNEAIIRASRAVNFDNFYGSKFVDQSGIIRYNYTKDMADGWIDHEYLNELNRRSSEERAKLAKERARMLAKERKLKSFENFDWEEDEEDDDEIKQNNEYNPDYESDLCDCFHPTNDGVYSVETFEGGKLCDLCLDCFEHADLIEDDDSKVCHWRFYSQEEEDKYFKRK